MFVAVVQSATDTGQTVTALVWVLVLASITRVVAERFRVPYIVALVLLGVIVSTLGWLSALTPSPGVILLVFLPPLLFQAALEVDPDSFGRTLPVVGLLAVPGVVITAIAVGAVVTWLTPLSIWPALLFGALIAATDPVSVVATFRQLGTPVDLTTMIEGESLFNDGTALVLSAVLLTAARTGSFDALSGLAQFAWAVCASIAIGGIGALAMIQVVRFLDNRDIEITLSMALAYAMFLLADRVEASGAVAVVVAGLITGSYGSRVAYSPDTRRALFAFWEYLGFLANAVLFVLIGLTIHLDVLWHNARWVVAAIVTVVLVRAALVYLLTAMLHRITIPYGHVLFWGGLRGGVAVAIALSIPNDTPFRTLILSFTFGVVLFTVLVQGLTIDLLVKRLGLVSTTPRSEEKPPLPG